VALPSCGAGTTSSGGSGDGDTDDDAGLRPPGLPPQAENPSLKLLITVESGVDGVATVSCSLTNNTSGASVSDTDVTLLAVHDLDADGEFEEAELAAPVDTATCNTGSVDASIAKAFTGTATLTGLSNGDKIYGAAANSDTVTKIFILKGSVTTIAGQPAFSGETTLNLAKATSGVDGLGTAATFSSPYGIEIDSTGRYLYIAEIDTCKIRQIDLQDSNRVTTVIGAGAGLVECGDIDGDASTARIGFLRDIAIDDTYLYIADFTNNKIRRALLTTFAVEVFVGPAATGNTVEGDGTGADTRDGCVNVVADGDFNSARFIQPFGVDVGPNKTYLYVSDTHGGHRIRRVNISTREVTLLSGPLCSVSANVSVKNVTPSTSPSGFKDGAANDALFNNPESLSVSPENDYLYVSDATNHAIRRIVLEGAATTEFPLGYVTTVIGASTSVGATSGDQDATFGNSVRLNGPFGTTINPRNNVLYILDSDNHKIRRSIIGNNYETQILAGPAAKTVNVNSRPSFGCRDTAEDADGTITTGALFYTPAALVVNSAGDAIYATNTSCNTVVKIQ